jgi:hypothetical protein
MLAVLGEPGVVHRPRRRFQCAHQPLGQPPAHRPPIPRGDRDEVVQRLVVHLTQTGGHRLDRLAAPVQHQPAQVTLPTNALIGARQRLEDVLGEGFQALADSGQLGRCDARHPVPFCPIQKGGFTHTQPSQANLTESY